MIKRIGVVVCFWVASQADGKPLALIYSGTGACPDGCPTATARMARQSGMTVQYVTEKDLKPTLFKDAAVWIQPGGNAIELSSALSKNQREMIRAFVMEGGAYLGFCAGAYFIDSTVDDAKTIPGLGLLAGETADYKGQGLPAEILPIVWRGLTRFLYFEGGPTFHLEQTHGIDIVANYAEGVPATLQFEWGKGRVSVSGVHPEAPTSWKKEARPEDTDGDDLALGVQMLRWATRQSD